MLLKNKIRNLTIASMACATMAISPTNGFATMIPIGAGGGQLNSGGLVSVITFPLASGCINFTPGSTCLTTNANAMSVSGSTPITDQSIFTSPSTGNIKDLPLTLLGTNNGTPAAPLLAGFLTVNSPLPGGVVNFDLLNIVIPGAFGSCSAAVNSFCNPGSGSPFDLQQNTATQVTITFSVNTDAYTGTSSSGNTPYIGLFSTQLSGCLVPLVGGQCPSGDVVTIPDILNYISTPNNSIAATWSATFSPVTGTPEPMSFLLFGSGLVCLGFIRRRRA